MKRTIIAICFFILTGCIKDNGKDFGQVTPPDRYYMDLSMKVPINDTANWTYITEFAYKTEMMGCITINQDSSTTRMTGWKGGMPVVTMEWEGSPWNQQYHYMTEQDPTKADYLKGRLTILNQSRNYDTVKLSHYPIQIGFGFDYDVAGVTFYTSPDTTYDNRGMSISGTFWFPKKLIKVL
jgi:hypothetical protein